jgi:hypothetical protein
LLQNEVARLKNTKATNELTCNLSKDQGFSSTAWEVFSQAIFTGSGGLLPMYQSLFPSAAIGANVVNTGMLMAHAGEKVIPAKVVPSVLTTWVIQTTSISTSMKQAVPSTGLVQQRRSCSRRVEPSNA